MTRHQRSSHILDSLGNRLQFGNGELRGGELIRDRANTTRGLHQGKKYSVFGAVKDELCLVSLQA